MFGFLSGKDKTYVYLYRTDKGAVKSGTIRAKSLQHAKDKFFRMPFNKAFTKLGISERINSDEEAKGSDE